MTNENVEAILSDFIDDLIQEKKPGAYNFPIDDELEKLFETVRAVKRTRQVKEQAVEEKVVKLNSEAVVREFQKSKGKSKRKGINNVFKRFALAAAAAVLIIAAFMGIPEAPFQETNIVHAVVKAYEELQGYSGVAELTSVRDGEIDFYETIEITYQKPWKYTAVHRFEGVEVKNISNGMRLVSVFPNDITVDNVFPEKELWRYHIGTYVSELKDADEVVEIGTEEVLGRVAVILDYRYSDFNHRIWIDKETKLPLRKELNLYGEGISLILEFKEIKINPEVDPEIFEYVPTVMREDIISDKPDEPQKAGEALKPDEPQKAGEALKADEPQKAGEALKPDEPQKAEDAEKADEIIILQEDKVRYEEVNRRIDLSEVKFVLDLDLLLKNVPSDFQLFTVGMLDKDVIYDYVLRFKGPCEKDFLDIYLSSTPQKFNYLPDSKVGKLKEGHVEINPTAWNVRELYQGESSIGRWVTPKFEVFVAANSGSNFPAEFLEKISGRKIEYVSFRDLEKEGIELPVEKDGH